MSLFESLGEKVERFKQEAEAARNEATGSDEDGENESERETDAEADSDSEYRCLECDAEFRDDREACPNCGAKAVVFDGE
ncbi:hypothetical protein CHINAEXTREME_13315 [Halobiforma lacisalsi AJ5]|uniref:Zinc ribbon domain-containing protein n=1 Tax=Natronobacterium lacisalsi AJ5 TaxID=358396 RepID=M0LKP2_NATLA|nr:zinc ribbon domain-containing protein [Halobiforma lacisalsi]APW98699.1 hypothetical protein CHINAEXTREME_13315 [Halobiforma lacisalsi AJ5]EMA32570.1 hypothetical protein C445_10652 [Halobiforma lacisalsi AJ5]